VDGGDRRGRHRFVYQGANSNADDTNDGAQLWVQLGQQAAGSVSATSATAALLGGMMKQPAFDTLRTAEQLGYVATAFATSEQGVDYVVVLVASAQYGADVLAQRIVEFVDETFAALLEGLSADEFATEVDSVAQGFAQSWVDMDEETAAYWAEIAAHSYVFDRDEQSVALLRALGQQDVADFFADRVQTTSAAADWLVVELASQDGPGYAAGNVSWATAVAVVDDLEAVKATAGAVSFFDVS